MMRGSPHSRQREAVLFDLDGLLVDSEPVWFQVRTHMFSRFGLEWTEEDQKALMGRSTAAWIDYVERKLEGRLTREEVVSETLDGMVSSYRAGRVRIMPGASRTLQYCRTRTKMALASGSPRVLIDAALEANSWRGLFSVVISSDEVGHGKPSPDVYVEAARRLNVDPQRCVVVEDSGSGILAGRAAGAAVIAVPNKELMPPAETLKRADIVLDSLESFEEAFTRFEVLPPSSREEGIP